MASKVTKPSTGLKKVKYGLLRIKAGADLAGHSLLLAPLKALIKSLTASSSASLPNNSLTVTPQVMPAKVDSKHLHGII